MHDGPAGHRAPRRLDAQLRKTGRGTQARRAYGSYPMLDCLCIVFRTQGVSIYFQGVNIPRAANGSLMLSVWTKDEAAHHASGDSGTVQALAPPGRSRNRNQGIEELMRPIDSESESA